MASDPQTSSAGPSTSPAAQPSEDRHINFTQSVFSTGVQEVTIQGGSYTFTGRDAITNTTHVSQIIPQNELMPDDDRARLLKRLPGNNFRAYHQAIQEMSAPGTGELFNGTDTVTDWITSKYGRLWCTGGPGIGKTYLTSSTIELLERLAKKSRAIAVIYAYLSHSARAQLATWDVIMALIRQLVESTSNDSVIQQVAAVLNDSERKNIRPTLSELVRLLKRILIEFEDRFVSLDGLDEMRPEQQVELLDIVLSLDAKVLIMSRHLDLLKSRLERQKLHKPVFMEVLANPIDLDLFIAHAIDKTPALVDLLEHRGIKQEVMNRIKEKADGMFLHVSAHVEALRGCTNPQDLFDEIKRFPKGVQGLYADTLKRIEKQPEKHIYVAKQAIVWLLHVNDALTIDALRHALAFTTEENPTFDHNRLVTEYFLVSICHGLVTFDKRTRIVRLSHYTAYETLPSLLVDHCRQPHTMIAKVCLARLKSCNFQNCMLKTVDDRQAAFAAYPLLDYSHSNWAHHVKQGIPSNHGLQELAEQFVGECVAYPYFPPDAPKGGLAPLHQLPSLHVAVLFDIPELALKLVHRGVDINTKTRRGIHAGWTSLALAISQDHDRMVEALIELPGIDLNQVDWYGMTPLMLAATLRREAVVRLLLQKSSAVGGINMVDHQGSSALMLASSYGRLNVVEMLLGTPGVEVNLTNSYGWSALNMASRNGYGAIVEKLLNAPGIDVNLVNRDGLSALMNASRYGYDTIVKRLLKIQVIDVNLVDSTNEWPALMMASRRGYNSIVKMLLDMPKIKVNLVDDEGWSSLMTASQYGHKGVVKMLLDNPGTDVNLHSGEGSALTIASCFGNAMIVKLLLDKPNIDVNLANIDGCTPLILASCYGYDDIVQMLLDMPGIEVNRAEKKGWSALIMASHHGQDAVAELLLRTPGINIDLVNADGLSASDIALRNGHHTIANMIAWEQSLIVQHGRRLFTGFTEFAQRLNLSLSSPL